MAQEQTDRRKNTARLKSQLVKGVKHNAGKNTQLTPSDITRIQKEIQILEGRIK